MASDTVVDVSLLHYKFRFRGLDWREEAGLDLDRDRSPLRAVLSHALCGVSGIAPSSPEEARRVIDAIPEPIAVRVWKVYRGSLPPARRFSTSNLYLAPGPSAYAERLMEDEPQEEEAHDRAVREMESRFSRQEVAEEAEISRRVLESARRGRARIPQATPDRGAHGRQ
jgi:hypothetical protein